MNCANDTVACFGDIEREYAALTDGVALVDRSYRDILKVAGSDRASWLHNLITNQVKTLGQGDGHYAFALNLKGRILFDLCLFVQPEAIWLDIDKRFFSLAQSHCQKYIITEDVALIADTESFVRFALAGPQVADLLVSLGASHAANLPMYGSTDIEINKSRCTALRTDFCGVFAIDLNVPMEKARDVWNFLRGQSAPCKIVLVGDDAVQRRRIEAAMAWPGQEITDEYLPAETGQFERAVATNKGCYLGQEIVERMRSRGALARCLVQLRIESADMLPLGGEIVNADGVTVGKLTSVCRSSTQGESLGLGIIKTAFAEACTRLDIKSEHGLSRAIVSK